MQTLDELRRILFLTHQQFDINIKQLYIFPDISNNDPTSKSYKNVPIFDMRQKNYNDVTLRVLVRGTG